MSTPDEQVISWLTMERYVLGELSEVERLQVERGLAQSELNRARLSQIRADQSELPRLSLPANTRLRSAPRLTRWIAGAGAVVAAAAAISLALVGSEQRTQHEVHSGATQVKGGDVSMTIVSQRAGATPKRFAQGERFKLLVTCPPDFDEALHVLIFQGGARFEPLPKTQLACGNAVPWPGAFALDGDEVARICLAWGIHAENAQDPAELGDDAICETIAPE